MTVLPTLRDAWAIAAAKAVAPGLRALTFAGGGDLALATVDSDGHLGIFIRARSDEPLQQTVSTVEAESGAIGAEIYRFFAEGRAVRGIHIWCRQPELIEAFGSFCDALVWRIPQEDTHSAFLACFHEFRLLVAGVGDAAAWPALIGLIGELVILSELVQLDPRAVGMWAYPARDRHDFRNGNAALEVKTSLRSQSGKSVVTIAAFDQLEPPKGGSLHLYWLRLERDPEGDLSMNRLLDQISGVLAPDIGTQFRARVMGQSPNPALDHRFTVQERRSFQVAPAFPRLTVDRLAIGSLDVGIARVSYELDLSAAESFRCEPGEGYRRLLEQGRSG